MLIVQQSNTFSKSKYRNRRACPVFQGALTRINVDHFIEGRSVREDQYRPQGLRSGESSGPETRRFPFSVYTVTNKRLTSADWCAESGNDLCVSESIGVVRSPPNFFQDSMLSNKNIIRPPSMKQSPVLATNPPLRRQ